MNSRLKDKEIEELIMKYYNELHNIEAYESKIRYYNENRDKIKSNVLPEIRHIQEAIAEKKYRNKYLEEILGRLNDEEKKYIELKYKRKLSVIQIESEMFIKERSYYRIRRRILNYLNDMVMKELN